MLANQRQARSYVLRGEGGVGKILVTTSGAGGGGGLTGKISFHFSKDTKLPKSAGDLEGTAKGFWCRK